MRIGELAAATGTTPKKLRFYEGRGLLPLTDRAPNGYRDYGQDAVLRLDFIRRGRAAGLTLAQIGEIIAIRDAGEAPCHQVRDLLAERLTDIDRQIVDLQGLRDTVSRLRDEADQADPSSCAADVVCRYL
jgi:DNA-binding transcriptional MerR regulator